MTTRAPDAQQDGGLGCTSDDRRSVTSRGRSPRSASGSRPRRRPPHEQPRLDRGRNPAITPRPARGSRRATPTDATVERPNIAIACADDRDRRRDHRDPHDQAGRASPTPAGRDTAVVPRVATPAEHRREDRLERRRRPRKAAVRRHEDARRAAPVMRRGSHVSSVVIVSLVQSAPPRVAPSDAPSRITNVESPARCPARSRQLELVGRVRSAGGPPRAVLLQRVVVGRHRAPPGQVLPLTAPLALSRS